MKWLSIKQAIPFSYILVTLLCITTGAFGQLNDIHFKHYSYLEGLAAPVRCIIQDQVGFIWLGTTDGLHRFDGKNFTIFRNMPGDSNSLCNNIINHLALDQAGNIWIGTNGGLCYFSNRDYRFHQIDLPDTLEPGDRYRIHALTTHGPEEVWFATKSRVHQLNSINKNIISFNLPEIPHLNITELYLNHQGQVWIGTNQNGIYLLNPKTRQLILGSTSSSYSRKQNLSVTTKPILNFENDTLLIGSWYGGLQKIYLDGRIIQHQEIANLIEQDHKKHIVTGIGKWHSNQWWIGTYGSGLGLFDGNTNQFIHTYRFHPNEQHSLSNDYINDVFVDNGGILWVGTESGLDKYDEKSNLFKLIRIQGQSNETSVVRLPTSILEDNKIQDKLWLTVHGIGLLYLNPATSIIEPYHLKGDASFDEKTIYSIYRDPDGLFWLGTRTGVYCFAADDHSVVRPKFPEGFSPTGVHKIIKDRTGKMWFATYSNGVYSLDQESGKIDHYSNQSGEKNQLPDNRIFCMLEDHQGNIWIGTQNRGLCQLNPITGKINYFDHHKNNIATLPDNNIYSLYEDSDHRIWIGTENGLALMDIKKGTIKTFGMQDGLVSNVIFSITPGQRNHLWLATNNGISDFDIQTYKFKNYFIPMGLPNNRMDGAAIFTSNSQLYFSSSSYLIHCDPKKLEAYGQTPPIVITGIRVFDKPIPFFNTEGRVEPIRLNYRQNMVSFEFTAINFNNPESNQYTYQLTGIDGDWMNCGSRQMVSYTNLSGGSYQFIVRSLHNNGTWYEALPVSLYIAPPFWKQWWFFGLTLFSLALVGYSFFQFRINQLVRLQKIRLNIARDLHDDIGSTLSSIHMVSTMAEQKTIAHPSAPLFKTISHASRQALDLMNEIVWSINPKNDRMEMMLIHMRQFTSELLEPVNINFSFSTSGEFNDVIIPLEKRKDFFLIFKEAINNLAKYSHATYVGIELSLKMKHLHLEISDNGRGFDLSQSTPGNGLKNMRSRADGIKGKLQIHSTPGQGTRIELVLPIVP